MSPFQPIERVVVGFRSTIQDRLSAHVVETLHEKTASLDDIPSRIRALEATLSAVEERYERSQLHHQANAAFHGGLTVHAAWSKHAGVRSVFASYHLPHCDTCPVGVDETLAEAAHGHKIPLEALLADLDQLLIPSKAPATTAVKR